MKRPIGGWDDMEFEVIEEFGHAALYVVTYFKALKGQKIDDYGFHNIIPKVTSFIIFSEQGTLMFTVPRGDARELNRFLRSISSGRYKLSNVTFLRPDSVELSRKRE